MTAYKLYIARDDGEYADEDYNYKTRGDLHIFYDTPHLNENGKWDLARKICDVPSYMYPEIKDGQCEVFTNTKEKSNKQNKVPIKYITL